MIAIFGHQSIQHFYFLQKIPVSCLLLLYLKRMRERERKMNESQRRKRPIVDHFLQPVFVAQEKEMKWLFKKKKFRLAVPSRKKTEKIPCFSHHHYCRPTIHRFLTDVMFHQSLPSIVSHLKRLWSSYFCCFFSVYMCRCV